MSYKKIKALILFFVFFSVPAIILAQSEKVNEFHTLKAMLIGLSYSYETPIANKSTINLEAIASAGFGFGFGSSQSYYYWAVVPKLRFEPRYYYNYLNPRKGDKDNSNSPNYWALAVDYQFGQGIGENIDVQERLTIIPKWGAKRIFKEKYVFEFAVGIGAGVFEFEKWKPAFGVDMYVGRILRRR